MKRTRPIRQRGFTLIEVVMAFAVSVLLMMFTVTMAGAVFRGSGRSAEGTALRDRIGVFKQQLELDLELAGQGSTGAVGVDIGVQPWASMAFSGPPVFAAITAVRGADGVGATNVGGDPIRVGSDMLQLVVPNPGTIVRTNADSTAGGGQLEVIGLPATPQCPFVLIVDSSSANGAGRTQLAERLNDGSGVGTPALLRGTLMFTVREASQVMCARLSTYWLADDGWLHRTDLQMNTAPVNIGGTPLWTTPVADGSDLIAPGVEDFQVAYGLSSELVGRAAVMAARWAFDDDTTDDSADGSLIAPEAWFEVRQVRASAVMRSLRAVTNVGSAMRRVPAIENGVDLMINQAYTRQVVSVAHELVSLRYFDKGLPMGITPEPY